MRKVSEVVEENVLGMLRSQDVYSFGRRKAG